MNTSIQAHQLLKGKYDELHDLILSGEEVLGYIDGDKFNGKRLREPVSLRLYEGGTIMAGHGLNSILASSKEKFLSECKRTKLQWVYTPRWISVKDRLPKEVELSLTDASPHHDVYVWAWDPKKMEAVKIKAYHVEDPRRRSDYMWSHWMYYSPLAGPK